MKRLFCITSALLALLLATPALGASEFDIANAEHDANTGASNGAKRVTPVDASGASLVSGGLKSNIVDTSGDSAVDATANAVKTVDVDNAGTALVGGRGSRVELLASGTDTTTATATTALADVTVPAWCTDVMIIARLDSVTTPGTNLTMTVTPLVTSTFEVTSGSLGTTAVTPAATQLFTIIMGPRSNVAGVTDATSTANSHIRYYTQFLPRFFRFARSHGTASTAISIRWFVYCYGG